MTYDLEGYKMTDYYDDIRSLYRERDRLIILGLTGRTGAGCTTVSKILATESIQEMDLKSYKTCDFASADERKYSVVYRFIKEGNRWKQFTIIEASTIIFSFIVEHSFDTLWEFVQSISSEGNIKGIDVLKDKLEERYYKSDSSMIADCLLTKNELSAFNCLFEEVHRHGDEKVTEVINVYTKKLSEKKNEFRNLLKDYTVEKESPEENKKEVINLYTYFMQNAGNNIRSSGEYSNNTRIAGKEVSLAQRIDKLIQYISRHEELINTGNEKIRICIDALRNSIEIQYFRDKYRSFYAMAVNTEDKYRISRIGTSRKEIESLDKIEYPDGGKGYFYHQNIEACIQLADIHLYNPDINNKKYYDLTEQIIKYIALMLQPGLITPTHVERCMQLAFNTKYNSGCLSRQVGAIVTGEDFSVRSVGWNDVPKGQVPCNLRSVEDYCRNKDSETYSDYELNDGLFDEVMSEIKATLPKRKEEKSGKLYSYCFKDIYNGLTNQKNQVYTRALHAEENAFLQIAKFGGAKVEGGKLFSTASPCEMCSKKAYQLGIKEIYYIDPYPGISRSHILSFGKSENPKMILFQGAIGNAYISLYSPKMPYKDEIKLITGVSSSEIAKAVYEVHKIDD